MASITPICHFIPIMKTWSGIIRSMVSRSSNIARICIFLYIQLDFRRRAASMVKSMPAEVGAAKRLMSRVSFQRSPLPHSQDGKRTKM